MATDRRNLRSQGWFAQPTYESLTHRAAIRAEGFTPEVFQNRPVIGICNSWSELNHCNLHLRTVAEAVKRGVWAAGGFPLEFPTISLGEIYMKPTTMLYRNLMAMDVEESIRANPLDGVVLLCGCDKTTPSLVMGACSVNIPTLVVSGGPMLTGNYKGEQIGTSDVWRYHDDIRVGKVLEEELRTIESAMCRSRGSCAVMGTASSMACMVEALGLSLPGNAAIPAADARRKVLAQLSGIRIVEMVREDLKLSDILTKKAFENAIIVNAAIGGSTNFVIHLLAIAGRIGIPLELKDFDRLSAGVPLIANLQPSGKYFMEDLFYAGGLPVVLKELDKLLNKDSVTANGKFISENYASAECFNREVISNMDQPFNSETGLAILTGNLCEAGAVIKPSAASLHLMQHSGKAVVFDNIEDFKARIDAPELDVDENSILVLKNVGPKGYPGMPEVGNMGIPSKLLGKGVKDMVRISDGRMSGTGFGTIVLHVSPEAANGGNFAMIKSGDIITLDVPGRKLNVDITDDEFAKRKKNFKPLEQSVKRGYVKLYIDHVQQAHLGADMDFLVGGSGSEVVRDSH